MWMSERDASSKVQSEEEDVLSLALLMMHTSVCGSLTIHASL